MTNNVNLKINRYICGKGLSMRRTIIVIMMFYAMLNCIANVSVTQSMYLPPQNVVAEFMEIEDLSEGSRGEGWFWNFSTATITDNNARFLDILTGGFISRDALAGSYPHLSPYANCANNPLSFIDPDGNRVVFADDMTEEQHRATMEGIHSLSAGGMFQNMYETLEDVEDVTTIRYGETVKDTNGNIAPGQFVPNEKGKGGTITFNKDIGLTYAVLAEELYHSYQNITPSFQDMHTNFEYEVKFFAMGACFDVGTLVPHLIGMDFIRSNMTIGYKYGTEFKAYNSENIEILKSDYIYNGKTFVNEHIKANSNQHHTVPVTLMPQRLINLIQK